MKNSSWTTLSRRQVLGGAAAAAGLSLAGCGGAASQPNLLWIIAEDFSPDLSCYGNKDLSTPNIDGLASQGMRFTSAFMTAPVCSAARSALAVGMYQTSVGGHNHRSHRQDDYQLPDPVRPFTQYLQEAGYHTSNLRNSQGLHGTGKTDLNYHFPGKLFDGEDWSERADGQPFYAQINFSETHRAFKRFTDSPTNPDTLTSLPPYYPDHPAVRLDWATYLDDAQHLDVKVGNVLKRLETEGLADDTIVFFFGDHGAAMPRGKQFLYDSGTHIPLIARIPEKYQPQGYQGGSLFENLVSSIDITATTLSLAGVEPPAHMEGRPFFGSGVQPREYVYSARDRCDETVDRIRSVRNKQFKYIRNYYPERAYTQQNIYKDTQYATLAAMRQLKEEGKLTGPPALFLTETRPPEEFFDIQQDPHEINNLIDAPEHQEQIEKMRGLLATWIKETGDMGETPESGAPAEQDKFRNKIDGWCTRTNSLVSKSGNGIKVETYGKGAHLIRAYVAEGGDLALEFRARSRDVAVTSVRFGSIEDLRNPAFTTDVEFKADGNWHNYSAELSVDGWLAQLTINFTDATGVVDFDWIRLVRKAGGRKTTVKQWDFV
jgi:N-sulfoglucosamine sulfohydrolase